MHAFCYETGMRLYATVLGTSVREEAWHSAENLAVRVVIPVKQLPTCEKQPHNPTIPQSHNPTIPQSHGPTLELSDVIIHRTVT
jgi:hypothetical protein